MGNESIYPPDLPVEPLTRRERDVLIQLESEKSNREIAEHLILAPSSVKWYIKQIYAKLGVNDRQQAISKAKELGLLNNAHPTPLHPNNLPVPPLPLIGRQHELEKVTEALSDSTCRLLSLVGPGGCGKTRLAQEAGTIQVMNFVDGVFFISLAPLETSEAIIPTIASSIGFKLFSSREDPHQQLLNYLREKNILLILDNFEHLLDRVELIAEILQTAPKVKIIVTSRVRLKLLNEQLYPIAGLPFPDIGTALNIATSLQDSENFSSISLFKKCAQRVSPSFDLNIENLAFVMRICRAVQGFPLGILLATGWLEMLTPAEIAEAIDQDFSFLETDLFDLPERQRSMRAVFNQSWKILTEHEREIFSAFSVFRGGFTAEAAHEITGANLRDLMGLTNKSLLLRDPTGRYHLHELLKQFSAEKLAENAESQKTVQNRHCVWFADFLHHREPLLYGKDQQSALSVIEDEVDNIRAGWDWAITHAQVGQLADYLESLGELYNTRGWSQDGVKLFARASENLSTFDKNSSNRAARLLHGRILMWQGILSADFDTADTINQLFQDSIVIFRRLGARKELAYTLSYYGILNFYKDTESLCQEGLNIFNELGDQRGIALAVLGLAWVGLHQSDFLLAKQRYQDSLTKFRELNDLKMIIHSLDGLGYTCWIMGEYKASQQHHEEMLALAREVGDQRAIAGSLGSLGISVYGLKDYPQSRELFLASLALYKKIGHAWGTADRLGDLGELALALGEYEQAAQFARESNALYARVAGECHNWGLRVFGNAALGMGNLQTARTYLHQALEQALKIHRWGYALLTLVGVANLLAKEGKEELALELLALIRCHPASWQMARDQAEPLIAELRSRLPNHVAAEAQARGQSRDLETTIQELLIALMDSS